MLTAVAQGSTDEVVVREVLLLVQDWDDDEDVDAEVLVPVDGECRPKLLPVRVGKKQRGGEAEKEEGRVMCKFTVSYLGNKNLPFLANFGLLFANFSRLIANFSPFSANFSRFFS